MFAFANGETVTIDPADFSSGINDHARLHGFSQKLGDSYSSAKSLSEAFAAFEATRQQLLEGDWNRKGGSTGGIWVEALARATGKPFETCLEKWNAMDEETRKAVKAHKGVKAAKAEIELERAQAKAADAPAIDLESI